MPDALTSALGESVAKNIASGDWDVFAIVGGGPQGKGLRDARRFLAAFDVEPTEQTVVIVCERKKK